MRLCCSLVFLASLVHAAPFSAGDVDLNSLPGAPDDFDVKVYAREPLVRNPCSIAFDARGRMFVSMGPQYRNPKPDTPPDSIVIVEDTNADGIADRTHTFATGFNCIQSLAWHGRDLWVANSPDLTVVRDLDGDDVADEYVKVFTDLGNIEHGIHGLNWAPDGRLYMSKGNSKGLNDPKQKDRIAPAPFRELFGQTASPGTPDFPPPQTFTRSTYKATYQDPRDDWGRMGGVLRCDDMGKNLEIVSRGLRNPYDIAFDHGFDWLGTDQDQNEGDRLFMPFYSAEFGWSHAWSTHWTGENHLPTVPISAPVYLGSGTGVLFADSPAWPASHRGVFIINDWLLKTTHIYRPVWDGALMQPQGGKWEDFIVPQTSLYRPVDMAFGADGALYIVGWGRGYGVEWDEKGNMSNEGRIYRVMPRQPAPMPALQPKATKEMTTAELIAEFDSVLPVRRIDAQDEIATRGKSVHADLLAALKSGKLTPAQETWTLWALARAGGDASLFNPATGNLNSRIQSIRILGLRNPLLVKPYLKDDAARIRFATVQAIHQAGDQSLIDALIVHSATEKDRVTYYATWRAMRDLGGSAKLRPLLQDTRPGVRCAALLGLLDLQAINPAELTHLTHDTDESVRSVALLGLGVGTKPDPKAKPPAPPSFALTSNIKAESGRTYTEAKLLQGQPCYTDRNYKIKELPDSLRGAAMIRTANADDRSRGQSFVTFHLALESTVIIAHDTRLKERPAWMQDFADTDLNIVTDDTTFHLWSKDFAAGPVVLGGNCETKKGGGFAHYFVILQPIQAKPRSKPTTIEAALAALPSANVARGEALFFLNAGCAGCHRVGTRGTNFGPDLTNLGARMEAKFVVQSMLDPNAVITEGFAAHTVEAAGKSYFGTLLSAGRTLKLGLIGGQTVELATDTIAKHETLPISPMPPQGALLGEQDVADITAWLVSQKSSPQGLHVDQRDDRLIITHAGAPVAHYIFKNGQVLRPFFAHVHALDGTQVTRNFPPVEGQDPTDHADMHPGIWLGFGDISGTDFWRNKGRIVHLNFVDPPKISDGVLSFATQSSMLGVDQRELAKLVTRISLRAKDNSWQLKWEADFTPTIDDFWFGDQEEMGLGVRVATPLSEKNGGLITSSHGTTTAKATWGQPAAWCDYSGVVNGHHAGIMIIPDPANLQPSWWHNRDYGVFVSNPFGRNAMKQGEKSKIPVSRGKTYRLVHTIIIHSSSNTKGPDLSTFVR